MTRIETRIAQAKTVAHRLRAEGRSKDAQDVLDLCHSAAILRATASSIHKELEDTRRACGMPTWERKVG